MTSVTTTCSKCGAKSFEEGPCPACLLETGLAPLVEEIDEVVDATPASRGSVVARSARMLTDFGDYELQEEIGRGGQGVVYRARQKSLNRIVALKVIGLGHWATEAHLKRFRMEAEAAAHLDDPRIVPIYEIGERDGACYFSMKFIEGGQLDKVIGREPMPVRKAADLTAKLARTLHYAHQHGVLHRDIKPGNILIDAKGEPHLTDFGLARLVETESTVTRTLEVLGTPSYMAPEQAAGKNTQLTGATDVYGLGAVFYQLLTGHPPFVGGTTYETVRLVLETEPRQPRLWNPKADRDVATICLKCLEKDPQRRYASALALAEDLECWLRHEPIRARRTGVFTRGRKWVRRNPTTTVLAASLVTLAGVVGVMVWESQSRHPIPAGIAVLPFENLSADPENAFFTDGVQDEILNDLAKIADLKVISRTSVMRYKAGAKRNLREIANELGVAHLVEGSVQRAANRVRVSAQLIDARTDTHLWAEHYDRPLDDVFAIQSEIAKIVADQLQAKLSPAEKAAIEQRPSADLGAYDRYVRARALLDTVNSNTRGRENLFQAVRLLDQAVARDPAFLLAYCELVSAHDQLHFYGIDHTPARLELANQALRKAMELGPGRGEVHLAIALHDYRSYDYEHARSEVAIAQRTLPNEPWVFALPAYMDRRQGHWAESIRNLERALELDPRNLLTLQQLAGTYLNLRRYADEALVLDRMLTVAPTDANTRVWRARVDLESRADPRPAHITIHEILAEDPEAAAGFAQQWFLVALCEHDPTEATRAMGFMPPEGIAPTNVRYPRSFLEALAARARGDAAAAQTAFIAARVEMQHIVDAQPDYAEAICVLGMVDAGLDRKEDALREGRRAIELLPITKDALNGTELKRNLAITYAWTGEKELALKELADTLQLPSVLTYGELRLHPYWDSLRGDPRFEKILAEASQPIPIK